MLSLALPLSALSHVGLFVTLWTVAHQSPLSRVFSRQEYWSGLPCPPPGNLPNPGTKLTSPASPALQVSSLPPELPNSLISELLNLKKDDAAGGK